MNNKFGVPCSQLKEYIKDVNVPCTSESEAMALAAGAWFAGKKSEVYMQNSGLGHILDVVKSLYEPYGIPLPHMLLSVRCSPEHHRGMYDCTFDLLKIMRYEDVETVVQSL